MDQLEYTTTEAPRKRGKHLTLEDRCTIKFMWKQGCSYRDIAKEIHCSPATICYELRRGTRTKTTSKGRPTTYSPRRGQAVYMEHRKNCGRKTVITRNNPFLKWTVERVRKRKWSLDACAGHAKANNIYPGYLVCTKTLYNSIHKGLLGLSLFDIPEALSRRKSRKAKKIRRKLLGRSIDDRPDIVDNRTEFGHWEIDTVVGRRTGKEAVVLTLAEKLTHYYITLKIHGKDAASVNAGMSELREQYGTKFRQVFKTITADNGSEFAELSKLECTGTLVYFAHPYSSWERGQNERHNRIFRRYLPKNRSIEDYSSEQIQWFADDINSIPRRSLGYKTSEELFEEYLDEIYAS